MPLFHAKNPHSKKSMAKAIHRNIKQLRKEGGRPMKQIVAIAYAVARGKKKHHD